VFNVQLVYDRCGSGHRWSCCTGPYTDGKAGHPAVSPDREVITVDLPGLGESPPPPDHLSYELATTII
jgi:pimeloyl-ACP methyl ester carboxylesterase